MWETIAGLILVPATILAGLWALGNGLEWLLTRKDKPTTWGDWGSYK